MPNGRRLKTIHKQINGFRKVNRAMVDFVYKDCKRRVNEKNGAGRVIYIILVKIAKASLQHLKDRSEILNERNEFGVKSPVPFKKFGELRKDYEDKPTMGECIKQ